MVLVEALLAGADVIAADCSEGVSQVLATGAHGTLVPAGDVESLADAMLKAARSPARSGESGRSRAEEFSVEKIVHRYAELLPSV